MRSEFLFFFLGFLWFGACYVLLTTLSYISQRNRLIEAANEEAEYWERREAWYDNEQEKYDNNH